MLGFEHRSESADEFVAALRGGRGGGQAREHFAIAELFGLAHCFEQDGGDAVAAFGGFPDRILRSDFTLDHPAPHGPRTPVLRRRADL